MSVCATEPAKFRGTECSFQESPNTNIAAEQRAVAVVAEKHWDIVKNRKRHSPAREPDCKYSALDTEIGQCGVRSVDAAVLAIGWADPIEPHLPAIISQSCGKINGHGQRLSPVMDPIAYTRRDYSTAKFVRAIKAWFCQPVDTLIILRFRLKPTCLGHCNHG